MKRAVSGIMLSLLFIVLSTLVFNIQQVKSDPATIIVPDDYRFIQDAINAAKGGDIVYVRAGIYYEVLTINKSISVVGEDRETTVIDALRAANVINVEASNVKLEGFTIRNGQYGIYIFSESYNVISGNIIANNSNAAIYVHARATFFGGGTCYGNKISGNIIRNSGGGLSLYAYDGIVRRTEISGNTIENNGYGISISAGWCGKCDYNVISGNSIVNNGGNGISVEGLHYQEGSCVFNTVSGNTILNNSGCGVQLLDDSSNNTISANIIAHNEEHGVLLVGDWGLCKDNKVTGNIINGNGGHGVYLYDGHGWCDRNEVRGNTIINNGQCGIRLNSEIYSCNLNTISENTIANNRVHGVYFSAYPDDPWMGGKCQDNVVFKNSITNSNKYGVYLEKSSRNRFFHNDLVNNTKQAYVTSGYANTWDDGYPSGGNYWGDYALHDEKSGPNQNMPGSDGIIDLPYIIDAKNRDLYPLIIPRHAIPVIWDEMIYPVGLKSNSTISVFQFEQTLKQISFNVTGPSGTQGFCNVTIPKDLMRGPWSFTIEGDVLGMEMSMAENETHSFLSFKYTHSSTFRLIIQASWVIPEFPSAAILPPFLTTTLITAIMLKRKKKPKAA